MALKISFLYAPDQQLTGVERRAWSRSCTGAAGELYTTWQMGLSNKLNSEQMELLNLEPEPVDPLTAAAAATPGQHSRACAKSEYLDARLQSNDHPANA